MMVWSRKSEVRSKKSSICCYIHF